MRILLPAPLQYISGSTCSRQTLQLAGCWRESKLGLLRPVTHTCCSCRTAEIGRGPGRFQKVGNVLLNKEASVAELQLKIISWSTDRHRAWLLCPRGSGTHPASHWQPRHPHAAARDASLPPGFSRPRESRAQMTPQQCWWWHWWAQAHQRPLTCRGHSLHICITPGLHGRTLLQWQHFSLQNTFLLHDS